MRDRYNACRQPAPQGFAEMSNRTRAIGVATVSVAMACLATFAFAQTTDKAKENPRPKILVRATPPVAIAPARLVLTAELVGGANDFEEFYCPTVEWDWGDDTRSETSSDCDPYEAGKSEIKRRFTVQHIFRQAGGYKIFFRLKRRSKEIAAASVIVQVRPGAPQFEP